MLIFDFDGTLVDSNSIWVQVDIDFLTMRGKKVTPEYTEFVSHAIFPTAAQFTKDHYDLEESVDDIMRCWMDLAREAYQFHAPLKAGVTDFLTQCATRGESMALFTAGEPQLCRLALERHGLERYFSDLLFAQEFGLEKRNPKAFTQASAQLGIPPERCVMFDDSPKNCLAARTAGMWVVGVHDDFFAPWADQVKANSHRYIHSFTELLEPSFGV